MLPSVLRKSLSTSTCWKAFSHKKAAVSFSAAANLVPALCRKEGFRILVVEPDTSIRDGEANRARDAFLQQFRETLDFYDHGVTLARTRVLYCL
jgi:hypothetical protein